MSRCEEPLWCTPASLVYNPGECESRSSARESHSRESNLREPERETGCRCPRFWTAVSAIQTPASPFCVPKRVNRTPENLNRTLEGAKRTRRHVNAHPGERGAHSAERGIHSELRKLDSRGSNRVFWSGRAGLRSGRSRSSNVKQVSRPGRWDGPSGIAGAAEGRCRHSVTNLVPSEDLRILTDRMRQKTTYILALSLALALPLFAADTTKPTAAAAKKSTAAAAHTNPFLTRSPLLYQAPPFNRI